MKLFGIEIEQKTNILALAAFMLSLGAIISNIFNILKGPEIDIIKPEQLTILSYKSHVNNVDYLKLYSDIHFFNNAAPGYDDVVYKEYCKITIGNKVINLRWQYFAISDFNERNEIIEREKTPAEPILIKARQTGGSETHFYPFSEKMGEKSDNFLPWNEFIKIVKDNMTETIIVSFEYSTFSDKSGSVKCKLKITENFIEGIEKRKRANISCF